MELVYLKKKKNQKIFWFAIRIVIKKYLLTMARVRGGGPYPIGDTRWMYFDENNI
jgi:hypothetical protein